jgi:hypothetical protein
MCVPIILKYTGCTKPADKHDDSRHCTMCIWQGEMVYGGCWPWFWLSVVGHAMVYVVNIRCSKHCCAGKLCKMKVRHVLV